jgi:hypothetical protein
MKNSVLALAVIYATPAQAWSKPSHCQVALQAAEKLTPTAVAFLSAHLYESMPSTGVNLRDRLGRGMAEVSGWADEIRASEPYHYSHTPYQACDSFVMERDCAGGKCLVTGIEKYITDALDVSSKSKARVGALKFLIHLIADATQPLHTGFKEDVGATKIQVISPTMTNLHVFWDFDLPAEYRKGEPVRDVIEDLPMEGFAAAIVSQTTKLTCEKGYKNTIGQYIGMGETVELSDAYIKDRARVAGLQLKRAAHYLAQILNYVADTWEARKAPKIIVPVTTSAPESFEDENRFVGLGADLLPEIGFEVDSELSASPPRIRKEKTEIQGIDLETIKLEKWGDAIVIKSESHKFSRFSAQEFDVMFGMITKRVFVDEHAFPGKLTGSDISRIFSFFKREPVAAAQLESKFDAMFRRARESKIPTNERVLTERIIPSLEEPILFQIRGIFVLLSAEDIAKDRIMLVSTEIAMADGAHFILVTASAGAKFVELNRQGVNKYSASKGNKERLDKAMEKNMRLFSVLLQLDAFVSGVAIPASEQIPNLIKELVRVRRDDIPDWECFEVVYSIPKPMPEDYVLFPLGPAGLGFAAKKDLRGTQDMAFEIRPSSGGLTLYLDMRLAMCAELPECVAMMNLDDYDPVGSIKTIPQSRQVVALREANAAMFNLPGDRRALRRYNKEKDKDGNDIKLNILLKGNHGK